MTFVLAKAARIRCDAFWFALSLLGVIRHETVTLLLVQRRFNT
jgi:hypothetical protein